MSTESAGQRRLKIGFLTALTLQDKLTSWSITNRYIARAMQTFVGDVTYIEPIHLRALLLGKAFNKSSQVLLKKGYMYYHSFYIAKQFAKELSKKLAESPFDVIIAPSCATEIAYCETDIPIVLIEDATFILLYEYYAQYKGLLQRSIDAQDALEGLALKQASLALYPSEWAARSARTYYQAGKKVHAVPFGGNIDAPPPIEVVQRRQKSGHCQLFFLGVDWERKGGAIAFDTLLKLHEMGIDAELIVCGCVPPAEFAHPRLTVIPFLNKKDEKQRKELDRLFETSDFLFLPTRGETYGMVFCEASAFGLPVITTNTGGVSGAVREGENGFLLPLEAGGAEYAALIARVYADDQRYAELVTSSRKVYDTWLNWDAWGKSTGKLIMDMLNARNPRLSTHIPPVSGEVAHPV